MSWLAAIANIGFRSATLQFSWFVAALSALITAGTYVSVKHWAHTNGEPRPQWIILYACALQAVWGFSLFFFGKSDIAAWAGLKLFPAWLMSVLFLSSSCLAYYALWAKKSIAWLLPQQALMMVAAISALSTVALGRYADGAEYPRIFILRDQLPEILTAIFHTAAIFNRERKRLASIARNYFIECGKASS